MNKYLMMIPQNNYHQVDLYTDIGEGLLESDQTTLSTVDCD